MLHLSRVTDASCGPRLSLNTPGSICFTPLSGGIQAILRTGIYKRIPQICVFA